MADLPASGPAPFCPGASLHLGPGARCLGVSKVVHGTDDHGAVLELMCEGSGLKPATESSESKYIRGPMPGSECDTPCLNVFPLNVPLNVFTVSVPLNEIASFVLL